VFIERKKKNVETQKNVENVDLFSFKDFMSVKIFKNNGGLRFLCFYVFAMHRLTIGKSIRIQRFLNQ
jgi:hypothetical protein